MTVRVRFAPSPTGYLHVGGLRTALYNYLFAKKHGGQFLLRIEDTDRKRYVEGATENLIDNLRWAGLDFDEGPGKEGECGPYFQSQRLDIYRKYAQQMVDAGQAYYAFDTAEELDAVRKQQEAEKQASRKYPRMTMQNSLTWDDDKVKAWIEADKPYVIRLKADDREKYIVSDLVRGDVEFTSDNVDDQVLIKADGFPTYHMAAVVDDHLMGITHIIRGEEWLSSVPKHLVMYEYLGWTPPKMAHLPLLLDYKGRKISKRHQRDDDPKSIAASVEDYREDGYLPEGLVNFLALLGWNPGDERELFTMEELIEAFSIERVGKSGSVFDKDKLIWVNAQHFHKLDLATRIELAKPALQDAGFGDVSDAYIGQVIEVMEERLSFSHDIVTEARYFFQDPASYHEKTVKKRWKENTNDLISAYAAKAEALEEFTAANLEQALKDLLAEKEVKMGALMLPLRVAVSGAGGGPAFYDMLALLGKDTVLRRIRLATERLPL